MPDLLTTTEITLSAGWVLSAIATLCGTIATLAAHPAIDKSPEEIAALFLHAATL
jgi:hypothetical protein